MNGMHVQYGWFVPIWSYKHTTHTWLGTEEIILWSIFTNILWVHLRQYFCAKKSSNLKCRYKINCARSFRMKKAARKMLVKLTTGPHTDPTNGLHTPHRRLIMENDMWNTFFLKKRDSSWTHRARIYVDVTFIKRVRRLSAAFISEVALLWRHTN